MTDQQYSILPTPPEKSYRIRSIDMTSNKRYRLFVPVAALVVGAFTLAGCNSGNTPTVAPVADSTLPPVPLATDVPAPTFAPAPVVPAPADVPSTSTSVQVAPAPAPTVSTPAKAVADKAASDKAAADKAASDKAVADKAAADSAAAAARAAAAQAAAAPRRLSGAGSKVTEHFSLQAAGYKVAWSANGQNPDNFIVYIHGLSGSSENLVNEIPPDPASGEAFFQSSGGDFYLSVAASTLTWAITLTPA